MLFNPNHRKKINLIWMIVSVIIILGMIVVYVPVLFTK
jgi:hypothetical protein